MARFARRQHANNYIWLASLAATKSPIIIKNNTQTPGGGMGEPGFPQKVEKKEKQNKQLNTI